MPGDESGRPARAERGDPAARTRRSPVVALAVGVVALAAVVAPTVWVATLDSNFAVPEAATSDGEEVVVVWRILLAMATAVCAVVLVLVAVAVVAGARRDVASETKGSVPLELTYTAVPLVLVGAIFAVSLWVSDRIDDLTSDPELAVEVEAFRWGWRFTYPGGREVVGFADGERPVLVLPVDRTVTLRLRTDDVIHSFFVPAFVTKLDMIPGEDNELSVTPTETGDLAGYCAEFCGLDHANMGFRVSVVEQDRFDTWLEDGGEGVS